MHEVLEKDRACIPHNQYQRSCMRTAKLNEVDALAVALKYLESERIAAKKAFSYHCDSEHGQVLIANDIPSWPLESKEIIGVKIWTPVPGG